MKTITELCSSYVCFISSFKDFSKEFRNICLFCTCRSVADIVQRLAGSLSTETYDMVVRRGHVLQDGLKRARRDQFSPSKRIKVTVTKFCIYVVFMYVCVIVRLSLSVRQVVILEDWPENSSDSLGKVWFPLIPWWDWMLQAQCCCTSGIYVYIQICHITNSSVTLC